MSKWSAAIVVSLSCCVVGIAVDTAGAAKLLRVGNADVKWSVSATGETTIVTYAVLQKPFALLPDKANLSPDNCGQMGPFADIVAASNEVMEETAIRQLRLAFDAWEAVANIKFVDVGEMNRADVIVGSSNTPFGHAFANLHYRGAETETVVRSLGTRTVEANTMPVPSISSDGEKKSADIDKAYICLNSSMPWKVGFDGNLATYDLLHTFTHEIGHAIGLDHSVATGAIMGYRYDERVNGLQPIDIASVQSLYGPPRR